MNMPFASPNRPAEHPRLRAARNALLWVAIIALAIFPFPFVGWW